MTKLKSVVVEMHPSPAYHAGRLLAVCQHIQDLAAPDVGRTYVDSYFSSACATPQLILPRVWKVARMRLRQIDRHDVRKDLDDLATRLHNMSRTGWPKRLSLNNQAVFQLGFFHQRANLPTPDNRRKRLCARGHAVDSNGEKLIADILFDLDVVYRPKERLVVPDVSKETGRVEIEPDFTLASLDEQRTLFIEFSGMLGIENYDRQWRFKRSAYAKFGARTLEEVQTDRRVTEHTMMQVISEDIRDAHVFRLRLQEALFLVLGIETKTEDPDHPF